MRRVSAVLCILLSRLFLFFTFDNGDGDAIGCCWFVGLLLCAQDDSKTCGPSWTKFSGSKDREKSIGFCAPTPKPAGTHGPNLGPL